MKTEKTNGTNALACLDLIDMSVLDLHSATKGSKDEF